MTQPHYIGLAQAKKAADDLVAAGLIYEDEALLKDAEAVQAFLRAAPTEAVAWRWRLISEPGQTDMDWSYTSVEGRARGWTNPAAWEVQALAVIPTEGGEGRDTEGMEE